MIVSLDGNQAKMKDFEMPLSMFTKQCNYALKNVHENKAFDKATKKSLDKVESITYTVVDPETFTTMKIKVLNPTPVITQDELDRSDSPVFITFPLDKTKVRPYSIEYGKVKVSIVAPDAVLVTDAKK